MNQMLTEVVDRGRKLSTVDGSCIPWAEGRNFFLGSLSEGA